MGCLSCPTRQALRLYDVLEEGSALIKTGRHAEVLQVCKHLLA